MAPSMVKLLRDLADAYEREEKGEADTELRSEIAELKEAIKARPKAEALDAMDELDDDELKLIADHRAGKVTPPPADDKDDKPATDDKAVRKTRPGRKSGSLYEYTIDEDGNRVAVDIPTLYSGADEPDEVDLPDEDEEEAA